ncbi:MAG: EamA family transporter [Actinobacteria bacterium]|nr:EamA family transporter [Actinomycetota bacterium]
MKIVINVLLFLLYTVFSGGGLVLIKLSLEQRIVNTSTLYNLFLKKEFIIGFIMYALGFTAWLIILSKFKLNFAFPIAMSLFFIFTLFTSMVVLKESITILHGLGIILCLIGIILITSQ